jgi:hypothetical protein
MATGSTHRNAQACGANPSLLIVPADLGFCLKPKLHVERRRRADPSESMPVILLTEEEREVWMGTFIFEARSAEREPGNGYR